MAVSRQQKQIAALLRKLEPEIRRAFERAIAEHAGRIDQGALIAALRAQDIGRAIEILRINRAILFPLDEAIRQAFIAGGLNVVAEVPRGMSGAFGFDGRHPRAERWVSGNVGGLIQGIEQEQIQTVRTVIGAGIQEGRPSADVARDITGKRVGRRRVGGFLGLTSEQSDSIIRGRARLQSGDPAEMRKYLSLKLRDRRYDAEVKRAIRDGKPITGRALDTIMEAHRSKALGYRGRVIAKNEAHSALAAGRHEAYEQMLENPEVDKITLRWQHNLSAEPRLDHLAMDGTLIQLGETFDFPDAQMAHPHDPVGGAKHSIGCWCIGVYRVRFKRD